MKIINTIIAAIGGSFTTYFTYLFLSNLFAILPDWLKYIFALALGVFISIFILQELKGRQAGIGKGMKPEPGYYWNCQKCGKGFQEKAEYDAHEMVCLNLDGKNTNFDCLLGKHKWVKVGGPRSRGHGKFAIHCRCSVCGKTEDLIL